MITIQSFNLSNYTNDLVVTDQTLSQLYNIAGDNVFVLPCGEQAKDFAWAQKLCSWFLHKNLPRNGRIVAVGGGSVGDVAGFAASIYKRGVKVLQVPTTLLAMVDSAIGGKTAINLDGVKNAVGTIIDVDTLIDTRFLQTLSSDQIADGFGEIEKYRLLDEQIACYQGDLDGLIALCANYKQRVVQSDLYDCGARKRLNLGHTVAHGLELTYGITHGQAVKYGLYHEMALAVALGVYDKAKFEDWSGKMQLDISQYPITDAVLQAMQKDKKNHNGLVVFVLPTNNFETCQSDLTIEEVKKYVVR